MPIQRIQPRGLHPFPLFTHVVKADNTVHIAGQAALDETGQIVGPGGSNPVSTFVAVSSLALPALLVEIDAVAVVDSQ